MDVVTLDNGKPVTRIIAECMPNIVQVHFEMQTMGVNEERWIDGTFLCQDLLPGWLWAPMDTATELPELPFRPWNTSLPICGLLNPFLYHTNTNTSTNTNILMLCYMTIQVSGIQFLHRCEAKKVKHFVL